MKHLIMGTAGHIDHGKTALIKALTGIECDTHKEEKERGITIHLGFTHLDIPSSLAGSGAGDKNGSKQGSETQGKKTGDKTGSKTGSETNRNKTSDRNRIGIIDVPGHSDFIHTMVGGASGIDFTLLVVAADSGIMPQTREHLQIMDILGIKKGLVAITKIDIVEPDILEMTEEEVRELTEGTFLQGCPVVKVSSKTGQGINELIKAISNVASGVENRPMGEIFKMFIDRIFTVKGFGTVVTGSVISGALNTGNEAYLLPGEKKLRVRRIERYGEEAGGVMAGDRAAINLIGLNREDYKRGMILSNTVLDQTDMIDATLSLFNHTTSFKLWTNVIFHIGTFEQQARIHLINCNRLTGGNKALVQIHLACPCTIQQGDRFVIRNTSHDITLGGGVVIDAFPLHHRKRPEKLIRSMNKRVSGELNDLVVSEVIKRYSTVTHVEIAQILNVSPEKVRTSLSGTLSKDIVVCESEDMMYLIIKKEYERIQDQLIKSINHFHRRNPLIRTGRTTRELMGIVRIDRRSSSEVVFKKILKDLEKAGTIKDYKGTWILSDFTIKIGNDLQNKINFVEKFLKSCKMQTPLFSELVPMAKKNRIEEHLLNQILTYLSEKKKIYFIDKNYIHAHIVDKCRHILLTELARKKEGITVAKFRDLVKGNRKICLLLFGIYDSEGVTERCEDVRVITEQGMNAIKERCL